MYAASLKKCSIIQLPFGPLNRSFEIENTLDEIRRKSVEVHARSIFSQGLLLQDENQFTQQPRDVVSLIKRFSSVATELGRSRAQLTMRFVISNKNVDRFLIGVDSLKQLKHLVEHLAEPVKSVETILVEKVFLDSPLVEVRPELWK